ncbi:uncharacterized protein LOC131357377 isoform X3 [Hemibagrus wyckioides]|uniref:uncharacterized protein LOC131357377 isoform X3 n=1 Tax=Hemibagrus wyckioides TaxID=337641 RepID=UPI00266CF5CB|nr:uncharacterized protein LOC131357377 isoform X3 [Hemibagrus wyckioides]
MLLKLENHYHVPGSAVNELLQDLHYLLSDASCPLSHRTIDTLQKHKIDDASVVKDLVTSLSATNPLLAAIKHGGLLASAFKRKQYYRENFKVVDPVEYVLETKGNKTFQYVPILQSIQNLLCQNDLLDKMVESHSSQQLGDVHQHRSVQDGLYFKPNDLFSDDLRISLCLYVDDFEICNPLGTSRKKHKLCAIYWVLGNVPSMFQSTLSSIYLAVLCTTEDVKTYGFEKILRPLLHDLQILEQSGETKDTLEEQRITLLSEVTKRNNEQAIKVLMDRTFAHRRHEVVEDMPFIVEFKNRWPALFTEREVSAEFRRITTIPLVSKFLGQLDYFSNQLFRIFKKKGGAEAQKITNILSVMDQYFISHFAEYHH